jgi:hypothetical protein
MSHRLFDGACTLLISEFAPCQFNAQGNAASAGAQEKAKG